MNYLGQHLYFKLLSLYPSLILQREKVQLCALADIANIILVLWNRQTRETQESKIIKVVTVGLLMKVLSSCHAVSAFSLHIPLALEVLQVSAAETRWFLIIFFLCFTLQPKSLNAKEMEALTAHSSEVSTHKALCCFYVLRVCDCKRTSYGTPWDLLLSKLTQNCRAHPMLF